MAAEVRSLILAIDSRKAKEGAEQFAGATSRAQRAALGVGEQLTRLDAGMTRMATSVRRALVPLGALVGAFSAVAAARSSIRTVVAFEETIATLQGVSRATSAQLERLTAAAKQFGALTRFTATEAGQGLLFLARAGFSAQQALDALPSTLDLAAAGLLDLGEAADIASNVVQQFNLRAADTARVVDALVIVSNRSNTNVRQLAEAMKFAGPVAGVLGVSVEETAAAVGALGNAGIQATLAGTGLRQLLLRLLNPSKDAQRAIEGLGLSLASINPEKAGLLGALRKLQAAQLGAQDAARIFGARTAGVALVLAQNVEAIERLLQATREYQGEARKMADIQEKTLGGSFRALKSAIESFALSVGDAGAVGALKEFLRITTEALRILAGVSGAIQTASARGEFMARVIRSGTFALAGFVGIRIIGFLKNVAISVATATREMLGFRNAQVAATVATTAQTSALAAQASVAVASQVSQERRIAAVATQLGATPAALAAAQARREAAVIGALGLGSVTRAAGIGSRLVGGLATALRFLAGPLGIILSIAVPLGIAFGSFNDELRESNDLLTEHIDKIEGVANSIAALKNAQEDLSIAIEQADFAAAQAKFDEFLRLQAQRVVQLGTLPKSELITTNPLEDLARRLPNAPLFNFQQPRTFRQRAGAIPAQDVAADLRRLLPKGFPIIPGPLGLTAEQLLTPGFVAAEQARRDKRPLTETEIAKIGEFPIDPETQADIIRTILVPATKRLRDEFGSLSEDSQKLARELLLLDEAGEGLGGTLSAVSNPVDDFIRSLADENQILSEQGDAREFLTAKLQAEAIARSEASAGRRESHNLDQREIELIEFEVRRRLQLQKAEEDAEAAARRLAETKRDELNLAIQQAEAIARVTAELEFNTELLGLNNAAREKAIALRQAGLGITDASPEAQDIRNRVDALLELENVREISDGVAVSFANMFEEFVIGAASAQDAIKALIKELSTLLLRRLVLDKFVDALSTGLFGALSGGGSAAIPSRGPGNIPAVETFDKFAKGGLFGATGGKVDRATMFPMGLAGEAGPEAILPLTRDRSGELGVRLVGTQETLRLRRDAQGILGVVAPGEEAGSLLSIARQAAMRDARKRRFAKGGVFDDPIDAEAMRAIFDAAFASEPFRRGPELLVPQDRSRVQDTVLTASRDATRFGHPGEVRPGPLLIPEAILRRRLMDAAKPQRPVAPLIPESVIRSALEPEEFAKGGILMGPTLFPSQNVLAGEAGPEAVLPLRRGRGGRLGVELAEGSGGDERAAVTNNFNARFDIKTPDTTGFRRSRGQLANLMARSLKSEGF